MHVHVSGVHAAIVFLYFVVALGTTRLIAEKFEGHPFADAWLRLY